jgi:GT2 family glycosyltransferase
VTARVAVTILQYGNWRDTVACLQSLVASVVRGTARVIVVDNASEDDSVARLERWIDGSLVDLPRPEHDGHDPHWTSLTGCPGATWDRATPDDIGAAPWTLVRMTHNRGFATGMNAGIRLALSDAAIEAVWLLNNDTVVHPDAIDAICAAMDAAPATTGQFGTTVCYYDRPTIVQSIGWCRWNPWLATAHRLDDGTSTTQPVSRDVVRQPGYVYGASWILRTAALRDVGLLSEDGFLYGEELDWSCRAAARWQTALIEQAVVWHREGATIGARAATPKARSELVDLSGISARLRISRRFFPRHLPAVYLSLFGAALNRLRQGDASRAAAVARLVLAGGVPVPWPPEARIPHSSTAS